MYSQPFYWGHQNIFWTLFLGLLVLLLLERVQKRFSGGLLIGFFAGVAIMVVSQLLHTDYGAGGVVLIFVLFYFREKQWLKYFLMAIIFLLGFGPMQLFGLIAVIPMMLYNGQRGNYSMKYFFYLFYPCHLIVLQLIWMIMNGVL